VADQAPGGLAVAEKPQNVQSDEMMKQARPAWWALLLVILAATLLLIIYGIISKSWPIALVELLIEAAALSIGAFLGFLFGMPRAPDGNADATYKPSTNLEQVSDWLTKILIGAGLAQLAGLRESLVDVGKFVSQTITPPVQGAAIVSQLVVIVFLVVGFVSSFLWTRLYYGRIQTLTDRALIQEVEELKRGLRAVAKGEQGATVSAPPAAGAELKVAVGPDAAPAQLPPEIEAKINKFSEAPSIWDSDPNADLFAGAPPEANGRRLEAEIITNFGDGLQISLKVVRVSGAALEDEILFLLHPTIPQRIHRVIPHNDVAETSVYSEGAFTVVACADAGKTVLAFNLVRLKDAPKWFRDN
jgi:hypothetical protein